MVIGSLTPCGLLSIEKMVHDWIIRLKQNPKKAKLSEKRVPDRLISSGAQQSGGILNIGDRQKFCQLTSRRMKPYTTLRGFSKLLSYVLGRRPYEFGLVLDENGFVSIHTLLKAIGEEKEWKFIREAHFHELLIREPDPPIELSGNCIRAVDRSHLPLHAICPEPPKLLFVCVRRKAHAHVLEKGISPSAYSRVVLSSDKDLALRMGRRYDPKAVLLSVFCHKCREQGVLFFQAGGDLFTAGHIPAGCFTGPAPALEREPRGQAPDSAPQQPKTPGTFILELHDENPFSSKIKGRKKEIPWKKDRKRLRNNTEYP
jgi:putative RNA 2'-phosphotransferase